MKQYLFLFLALGTLLVACDKDKFETKPQISIKSVNNDRVPYNGILEVLLEFADKEGDVSDSLFVIRERLNRKNPIVSLPSPFKIPAFPERAQGEMQVRFDFQTQLVSGIPAIVIIPRTNPATYEPDTMRLKFVARDLEGNVSDTVVLDNVIVERK